MGVALRVTGGGEEALNDVSIKTQYADFWFGKIGHSVSHLKFSVFLEMFWLLYRHSHNLQFAMTNIF